MLSLNIFLLKISNVIKINQALLSYEFEEYATQYATIVMAREDIDSFLYLSIEFLKEALGLGFHQYWKDL